MNKILQEQLKRNTAGYRLEKAQLLSMIFAKVV